MELRLAVYFLHGSVEGDRLSCWDEVSELLLSRALDLDWLVADWVGVLLRHKLDWVSSLSLHLWWLYHILWLTTL